MSSPCLEVVGLLRTPAVYAYRHHTRTIAAQLLWHGIWPVQTSHDLACWVLAGGAASAASAARLAGALPPPMVLRELQRRAAMRCLAAVGEYVESLPLVLANNAPQARFAPATALASACTAAVAQAEDAALLHSSFFRMWQPQLPPACMLPVGNYTGLPAFPSVCMQPMSSTPSIVHYAGVRAPAAAVRIGPHWRHGCIAPCGRIACAPPLCRAAGRRRRRHCATGVAQVCIVCLAMHGVARAPHACTDCLPRRSCPGVYRMPAMHGVAWPRMHAPTVCLAC
jgi:hypothetical protein